jgi:hypothetical protein
MQSKEALVYLQDSMCIPQITLDPSRCSGLSSIQPVSEAIFDELAACSNALISQQTSCHPKPTLKFDHIIQCSDEFELRINHSDEALDLDDYEELQKVSVSLDEHSRHALHKN